MQSRIAQMHEVWRELTLLKSVRQPLAHKDPTEGLDELPSPPFLNGATPLIQIVAKRSLSPVAVLFSGRMVAADTEAVACDEGATSASVPSTPPTLTTARRVPLSCGSIDLPQLPPESAEPVEPASPPLFTSSSPRAGEPDSAIAGSGAKRLRRKVSKHLSKMAIDLSQLAQKMSPRGGRSSPEASSPVRRASPPKDVPLLASLPIAERNRIAVKMAAYCQSAGYAGASPTRQTLLFNGHLIGLLAAHPDLIRPDTLKALHADLQWRMRYACVDTELDLEDPAFAGFVQQVVQSNFIKPWTHDSTDTSDSVTGANKKNGDVLRPTFVRDFDNSDYFFRRADGCVEKIVDTDQFIRLIGPGSDGDLPRIVSNIASQNLGNFLKNVLFLRQDADGNSQSVLRLHDGTPVMPLALTKASYVFSKADDGTLVLDYAWKSSAALNAGKALRVKRMSGDHGISEVQEAELGISVRLTIAPDGQWRIGHPAIRATGWHLPVTD